MTSRTPSLYVLRGVPGCGKSTRALAFVNADEDHRIRVNRDLLRTMTHGGRRGSRAQERKVTALQKTAIRTALGRRWDVVIDDTNLYPERISQWAEIAAQCGATYVVWDMTNVPLDVCLANNEQRAGTTGYIDPDVIRDMWATHVEGQPYPLPLPDGLAGAVIQEAATS